MDLLDTVIQAIELKKGVDIVSIDMKEKSPFCDTFVICTASSHRQIHAIVESVLDEATKYHYPVRSIEGNDDSNWTLIDLYDVVVHVFTEDARQFYQLEKLWYSYE